MQQPARRGVVDVGAGAQRGEHVVHEPAVVVHVTRIVRHYPRHARRRCELDERAGERGLVAAAAMMLHLDRDASAERFAPFVQRARRPVALSLAQHLRDDPARRTREQVQPPGALGHVAPP